MALWTPLDLGTKLLRWWSSADAATVTQSGGAVSAWANKTGTTDPANTAVGTQQPTYSATGFPGGASAAIVFDGTTDVFNIAGPTYSGTTGFTFLAVVQNDGAAAYRTILSGESGSASFRLNNNHTLGIIRTNVAEVQNSTATVSTGAHLLEFDVSSGTSSITIDGGTAETQSSVDPGITVQQTLIGMNGGGSSPFSGAVGDLYLCQKLTADEKAKLQGYSAHARGIQTNLPSGHPYRSAAPTTDTPKTFYLKAALASGSNMGSLQDGGTAPTRVANTGWNVGANTTATPFAMMAYGQTVSRTAFVATSPMSTSTGPVNTLNAATAWRSENAYTGTFAATLWEMTFAIRSTNGTAQRGNIKVRVWASTSPTAASNVRELTPGFAFQGNALTSISMAVDNITSTEWTPGAPIVLANEYIFVECEWRVTTAGATTAAALVISDGAASNIVTSAFTPSAGSVGSAAGIATAAATGRATAAASGSSPGLATTAGTGRSTAVATGSSAGLGAAQAVGLAIKQAAGSAAGLATAAATGASKASAAGQASGIATAAASGVSTAQAAGTSAGTSTANGITAGGASAVGTAAGIATASGVGRAVAAASGTSAGVATASAVASGGTAAQGVSAGIATATGVGAATARAAGQAAGIATATGSSATAGGGVRSRNYIVAGVPVATLAVADRTRARNYIVTGVPALTLSAGIAGGVRSRNYIVAGVPVLSLASGAGVQSATGTAAGSSTAAAVGRATVSATGSVAGVATAAGTGRATVAAAGTAAGTATAAGVGRSTAAAAGSAAGVATVTGNAPGGATGQAAGVATATGVGAAKAAATGTAAGLATVTGDASQLRSATGSAAGTATATAAGATLRLAGGTAAGVATATATGRATIDAVGLSAGAATATAVGRATARAAGVAAGTSTALGDARGKGWGVIVPPSGTWTVIPPPGGVWDEAA